MTSFRTELNIKADPKLMNATSRIITLGSCFAEVMGHKMQHYKLPVLVNPFGTIFNPVSLCKLLQQALNPEEEFTGELVERDGSWYAYDLHSSLTAPTRAALLQNIRESFRQTGDFLVQADVMVLTLGTAVAYVHRESQQVVANCHKIPQHHFQKHLLSIPEMLSAFHNMYAALQQVNPQVRILLTVSPVRHLKETFELNSVSKSSLRVLCHQIVQAIPTTSYFPAYEIMLDDLRDYRFYKADMLHPSAVAEDYIWEKFIQAFFDQEFRNFIPEWDQVQQALQHRPFKPTSEAHQSFLRRTLRRLEQISPKLDLSTEIEQVKSQLQEGKPENKS